MIQTRRIKKGMLLAIGVVSFMVISCASAPETPEKEPISSQSESSKSASRQQAEDLIKGSQESQSSAKQQTKSSTTTPSKEGSSDQPRLQERRCGSHQRVPLQGRSGHWRPSRGLHREAGGQGRPDGGESQDRTRAQRMGQSEHGHGDQRDHHRSREVPHQGRSHRGRVRHRGLLTRQPDRREAHS